VAVAFEDAEHDRLVSRSSAPFTPDQIIVVGLSKRANGHLTRLETKMLFTNLEAQLMFDLNSSPKYIIK
jgi:hypothetical protein